MKKVIVFLIDSFMPEALEKALEHNKLPLFEELIKRGEINQKCISVFPTTSSNFNATIITGKIPSINKIPAPIWYSRKENKIINYEATSEKIIKLGISRLIKDILYNQNTSHLNPNLPTIFEQLDLKGYTTGAYSCPLYRGYNIHHISFPWFIKPFTRRMPKNIAGPHQVVLGPFINSLNNPVKAPKTIFARLGLNDEFTVKAFIKTIQKNKQADFSLLNLATTGEYVHKNHLEGGVEGLIKVNDLLKKIVVNYGSLDKALQENVFILTGNHSQIKTNRFIHLDFLLRDFKYPALRDKITSRHNLIICNNERMVFLYYREDLTADKIISELIKEPGIDLIARKSGDWIKVYNKGMSNSFSFKRGEKYIDEYGQNWNMRGNFNVLDLLVNNEIISYRTYPDALNMLASAIESNDSPAVIATAKVNYMFKSESSPTYKEGGSHGGLHYLEMRTPFIVSEKTNLPLPVRAIDIKDYLITLMALFNERR